MIEKKSLEQIIESIFLLVSEAKEQSLKIEAKNSFSNINLRNQSIESNIKKVKGFENKQSTKPINTEINREKDQKVKKEYQSDWSNIKFFKPSYFKDTNQKPKQTLMNAVKFKSEKKLNEEIDKWAGEKLSKLLEKQMKTYTNSLLK